MGPIKSFSSMIDDVRSQTNEVDNLVRRIRAASNRLTGSTGQTPTPINATQQGRAETADRPPLLIDLTVRLEALNSVVSELRDEVTYLEQYSETAEDMGKITGVAGLSGFGGTGSIRGYA